MGKWALLGPGKIFKGLKFGPEAYFFSMREHLAGLIWMAPSIGVVCFLAETGKRVLTEPGAM